MNLHHLNFTGLYLKLNQNSDDKLYLIQTIKGMVADTQEEWQKTIDTIMSSIHGNGETKNDSTDEGQEDILKYRHDVSEYLLSYVLDISPSGEELQTLTRIRVKHTIGNYVSSMVRNRKFICKTSGLYL